jgi:hypothetical protein
MKRDAKKKAIVYLTNKRYGCISAELHLVSVFWRTAMAQGLTRDQKHYLRKAAGLVAITVEWRRGELPCRNLADMGLFRCVDEKEVPGLYTHTRARHWSYCLTQQGREAVARARREAT